MPIYYSVMVILVAVMYSLRAFAMDQLVDGVQTFQTNIFPSMKDLFTELAQGQHPHTLFVTCSDSRIDPNLLTQTKPGELFVLRNAGNIIPPYGSGGWGEAASIEFAIEGLGVHNVIVCGHSQCGAINGLLKGVDRFPALQRWLLHAHAVASRVRACNDDDSPAQQLNAAIEENVLLQITHLYTHPSIRAAVTAGKLNIYGWIYHIESGMVRVYNPNHRQFENFSPTGHYVPVTL